ncbi:MAG TPA: carbohydrate kinase family protein [Candidatus Nanoarchaeia archaeon]|nr:carbohydrate kinase family protein [Candidatus Nanoarchaeia archaeon]
MKMYDVIVVGSASIDVFIASKSKDIEIEKNSSHEDVCLPIGAKILLNSLHTGPGGGGVNVSAAFARLGLKTALISKLGKDEHAELLKKFLKREKVAFLGSSTKGKTGYSIIITKLRDNRTILTYKGNNDELKTTDFSWNKLKAKWLYLGTMLGQSHKTQCKIAKYAKKNGINILFNPSLYLAEKGEKYLKPILDACNILVLNKEEAQALTRTKAEITTLLKKLQQKIPLVVITDGPKGAYAYNGIKMHSMRPKKVRVIETTGAGDSFTSAFLAAIMHKQDLPTALKWGAAQASSVIQHYGATNILLTRKEIIKHVPKASKVKEVSPNKFVGTSSRKLSEV